MCERKEVEREITGPSKEENLNQMVVILLHCYFCAIHFLFVSSPHSQVLILKVLQDKQAGTRYSQDLT